MILVLYVCYLHSYVLTPEINIFTYDSNKNQMTLQCMALILSSRFIKACRRKGRMGPVTYDFFITIFEDLPLPSLFLFIQDSIKVTHSISVTYIRHLQQMQNVLARDVTRILKHAYTTPALTSLHWLKVEHFV